MKKNNLYIIFLGLIFLASCGGGLSEEEKNAIENSEKNWNVNYEMANYLSEKLMEIEEIKNSMNDSLANIDSNIIPKSQKEIVFPEFNKIKKNHANFIKDLEKENKEWLKFKNLAMKGEVTSSEFDREITQKHRGYFDYQKRISTLIFDAEKLLKKIKGK